jgi:hypothetical protein
MRNRQIALEYLRKLAAKGSLAGDVGRGLVAAAKGFLGSGKHISKVMAGHGVKSPVAHAAAKAAPYAVAAYGGKKAYESPTGQKLRYRLALWKQRREMKKAMRGR